MARPRKDSNAEVVAETATTTTAVAEKPAKKVSAAAQRRAYQGARYIYTLKYKVIFTRDLLATAPNKADIWENFVTQNDEVNAETLQEQIARTSATEVAERGMTVFARDPETGKPQVMGYTIKGFLKESAKALGLVNGTKASKIAAMKLHSMIDGNIAILEEFCDLYLPENTGVDKNERPLKAETMKGPRVALTSSEQVSRGTWFEVTIECDSYELVEIVQEAFDRGQHHGTGQWRSAGNGWFDFELISAEGKEYQPPHPEAWDAIAALPR